MARLAPRLALLARDLHRDPELGTQELHAVSRIAGELEEEGLQVEVGVAGLPTSLRAMRAAGEGPSVAFFAEYDAIPSLGHAAGHNLLTAASVGASIALSRALGPVSGRVLLFGAPAEETIGGKVVMAMRGAFDGIDAALLAHPGHEDRAIVSTLASWSVEVLFEGRAAHAVADPTRGIDALDALIRLFSARNLLLSTLRPGTRMPGVILEGGVRPNLIPARARARFSLRAESAHYLVETVAVRFREIVAAVARETATHAQVTPIDNLYDEMSSNAELAMIYSSCARDQGMNPQAGPGDIIGSLDMGTVSHLVPALHPMFRIGDGSIASHTAEFTQLCASQGGFDVAMRAATALALTGLAVLTDRSALERMRRAHRDAVRDFSRAEVPLVTEQVEG
ncbi:MAG: amidohydrolase [Acidobacteriota bacterium]